MLLMLLKEEGEGAEWGRVHRRWSAWCRNETEEDWGTSPQPPTAPLVPRVEGWGLATRAWGLWLFVFTLCPTLRYGLHVEHQLASSPPPPHLAQPPSTGCLGAAANNSGKPTLRGDHSAMDQPDIRTLMQVMWSVPCTGTLHNTRYYL